MTTTSEETQGTSAMFLWEVSVWLGKRLPSNMPEMLGSCQVKQPRRQAEDVLASGEVQDLSEEEEGEEWGLPTTTICLRQACFNHSHRRVAHCFM